MGSVVQHGVLLVSLAPRQRCCGSGLRAHWDCFPPAAHVPSRTLLWAALGAELSSHQPRTPQLCRRPLPGSEGRARVTCLVSDSGAWPDWPDAEQGRLWCSHSRGLLRLDTVSGWLSPLWVSPFGPLGDVLALGLGGDHTGFRDCSNLSWAPAALAPSCAPCQQLPAHRSVLLTHLPLPSGACPPSLSALFHPHTTLRLHQAQPLLRNFCTWTPHPLCPPAAEVLSQAAHHCGWCWRPWRTWADSKHGPGGRRSCPQKSRAWHGLVFRCLSLEF